MKNKDFSMLDFIFHCSIENGKGEEKEDEEISNSSLYFDT